MSDETMVCVFMFKGDCDNEDCALAKKHEFYNNEIGDEFGCNGFECPYDATKKCHCVDTAMEGK